MIQKRLDFPLLVNRNIVYADTAATSMMPLAVLRAMEDFSTNSYANVHRGLYKLAIQATDAYEQSRGVIGSFFGCSADQVIITRGCTDGLNMLLSSLFEDYVEGDQIITSIAEHHSAFVPLQQLAKKKGCLLHILPLNADGVVDCSGIDALLNERTKLVCVVHLSNVLGSIIDTRSIADTIARRGLSGQVTLVADGAQSAAHLFPSFADLGVDYYVCSAHKMYGPTGVGAIIAKPGALQTLKPSRFGGEMVDTVTIDQSIWGQIPLRFEAGTPPIVQTIGFAAALRYIQSIGLTAIKEHEGALLNAMVPFLAEHAQVYGVGHKHGCISFIMPGVHSHDVVSVLDDQNICVRSGTLCAQPLMRVLGIDGVIRISFGIYNTLDDVRRIQEGLLFVKKVFS